MFLLNKILLFLFLNFFLILNLNILYAKTVVVKNTITCDDSRKIYKVCSDQNLSYMKIHAQAVHENKQLVLIFGADWCPWCQSMNKIFQDPKFRTAIDATMIPLEIGIYKPSSREQVESGTLVLNHLFKVNKLDRNAYKGIPLIALVKPNINSKMDKAIFIKTGDLEKNSKAHKGHDPEKVLKALLSAQKRL